MLLIVRCAERVPVCWRLPGRLLSSRRRGGSTCHRACGALLAFLRLISPVVLERRARVVDWCDVFGSHSLVGRGERNVVVVVCDCSTVIHDDRAFELGLTGFLTVFDNAVFAVPECR